MRKIMMVVLIITLPLFILLKSIEVNTFNKKTYINSFEKHNTIVLTGKSMRELEEITEVIFSYLEEDLDGEVLKPYFNEREIKHMEDVQLLFKYGFIIKKISLVLSLFIIIICLINKKLKKLGSTLFYGIFAWWVFFLLLFTLSMIDFNKYFTYFHLIFFDNDLWLLNPKTDLLIQMLPEEFFISIFIRIVLLFLSILAIIQIVGYILTKKGKDYDGRIIEF